MSGIQWELIHPVRGLLRLIRHAKHGIHEYMHTCMHNPSLPPSLQTSHKVQSKVVNASRLNPCCYEGHTVVVVWSTLVLSWPFFLEIIFLRGATIKSYRVLQYGVVPVRVIDSLLRFFFFWRMGTRLVLPLGSRQQTTSKHISVSTLTIVN